MKIEHTKLSENIHLLTFETQKDITTTFLRFQEHYESPKFNGKVFSLEEYKNWYVKESPYASPDGEFTYYTDWSGFNIPSRVLQPFHEGKFNPLSEEEKNFLDLFKNEKEPFYIIGVNKETVNLKKSLKHELAHALFSINPEYRTQTLEIVGKYETGKIREVLRQTGGYSEEVLVDEVHAYGITGANSLKLEFPAQMTEELNNLFDRYAGNILL